MTGTIINFVLIIIGSLIGLLFGKKLSDDLKGTLVSTLGLFTAGVGLSMFLKNENPLFTLVALVVGGIIGEWWNIEGKIAGLGVWLEKRFTGNSDGSSSNFVRGFLVSSVLFCTGPMAILGAISDGLHGDYLTLAIKSIMDGIISIAFSSTLGIGVMFSAIPVTIYQGTIALLSNQLQGVITESMMNEMTATGGILLMGIGVSSLMELRKIRVGNLLPALFLSPLFVYLLSLFK
ncbi:MAG TPA: DUF554 domain-containing protein [Anaerolineales bacterium]|nr:DUF554 domain-containing protein [Anaerolineales bacterium]